MEVLCEQPGIEPKKAKTEWQLQSAGSLEGQQGFLWRGLVEPAPRKEIPLTVPFSYTTFPALPHRAVLVPWMLRHGPP